MKKMIDVWEAKLIPIMALPAHCSEHGFLYSITWTSNPSGSYLDLALVTQIDTVESTV